MKENNRNFGVSELFGKSKQSRKNLQAQKRNSTKKTAVTEAAIRVLSIAKNYLQDGARG